MKSADAPKKKSKAPRSVATIRERRGRWAAALMLFILVPSLVLGQSGAPNQQPSASASTGPSSPTEACYRAGIPRDANLVVDTPMGTNVGLLMFAHVGSEGLCVVTVDDTGAIVSATPSTMSDHPTAQELALDIAMASEVAPSLKTIGGRTPNGTLKVAVTTGDPSVKALAAVGGDGHFIAYWQGETPAVELIAYDRDGKEIGRLTDPQGITEQGAPTHAPTVAPTIVPSGTPSAAPATSSAPVSSASASTAP